MSGPSKGPRHSESLRTTAKSFPGSDQMVHEKLQMHWNSHMDQYDVLSHPHHQSLLPYLITSQPRPEHKYSRQLFRFSDGENMRESAPLPPLDFSSYPYGTKKTPGLSPSGPYGADPLWRSQQLSFLYSKQRPIHSSTPPPTTSDSCGAAQLAPDEQGNPRQFQWYRRSYLGAPGTLGAPSRSGNPNPLPRLPFFVASHPPSSPHRPLPPLQSPVAARQSYSRPSSPHSPAKPLPMREDPIYELDPMLIPRVDPAHVARYIPGELRELFQPPGSREQPHLDLLRHRKRRLAEAFATGDMSLSEDAQYFMQESKISKRRTTSQGLLTDAEKKANHIASEQKRRANIRRGYDMLVEKLPSLHSGAMEPDAHTDMVDDEGRSSSFSEIVILEEGASLTILTDTANRRLRSCLQEHHGLLLRKAAAQKRLLDIYSDAAQ